MQKNLKIKKYSINYHLLEDMIDNNVGIEHTLKNGKSNVLILEGFNVCKME